MIEEEDALPWRATYRRTLPEEATPALDEVILRVANRRAARIRALRRSAVAFALVAVAILPIWRTLTTHEPEAARMTNYGYHEGATRYYLLNVAGAPYTGPESKEQKR